MALKSPPAPKWDTPERRAFGATIRKAREAQGMSQEALAVTVGITAPYVSQIERGQRIPSPEVCRALAEALPESGLYWSDLVYEAQRLRSSEEIAPLFTKQPLDLPYPTPKVAQMDSIRRFLMKLEHSPLSEEQINDIVELGLKYVELEQRHMSENSRGHPKAVKVLARRQGAPHEGHSSRLIRGSS